MTLAAATYFDRPPLFRPDAGPAKKKAGPRLQNRRELLRLGLVERGPFGRSAEHRPATRLNKAVRQPTDQRVLADGRTRFHRAASKTRRAGAAR